MITILVVEDNERLRNLMAITLMHAGYTVQEAGNGEEALSVLETIPVCLILLDLLMPVMGGLDFLRAMKRSTEHIPTLVITANEVEEDRRKAFALGADGFLRKPVDMAELLKRVDTLLRQEDTGQSITLGSTSLHADTLTVSVQGVTTQLSKDEFCLLRLLLSHPGRIFTQQALLAEARGYKDNGLVALGIQMEFLQHKFASNPDFTMETVRGLGYRAVMK